MFTARYELDLHVIFLLASVFKGYSVLPTGFVYLTTSIAGTV